MAERNVTLRRAREADADAIIEVMNLSKATAMPWLPVVHTPDEDRNWVRTILLPEHEVWVADRGGRIVGVLAVRPGWLDQLYILPAEQGTGIGTRMLRIARESSPNGLHLWAFQGNERARRFYERAGFVVERETEGEGNEEKQPDVLYRWTPDVSL